MTDAIMRGLAIITWSIATLVVWFVLRTLAIYIRDDVRDWWENVQDGRRIRKMKKEKEHG